MQGYAASRNDKLGGTDSHQAAGLVDVAKLVLRERTVPLELCKATAENVQTLTADAASLITHQRCKEHQRPKCKLPDACHCEVLMS